MNTKRIFARQFKALFFVGLILILFSGISQGATHYVSPDTNYTWAESTNINTPCSATTAMSNAVAGDTVCFRGGTYNVENSPNFETPALNPAHSGSEGSPIVFKAYSDENAIIKVSDSCSDCQAAIGSHNKDYITWDGFTVDQSTGSNPKKKGLIYCKSQYCIVQNCVFIGKTVSIHDNVEGVRIEHSTDITVQNCTFSNYDASDGEYLGISGIKGYHGTRVIIENCDFNNCMTAIYPKSTNESWTIRHNRIANNEIGIYATPYSISGVPEIAIIS